MLLMVMFVLLFWGRFFSWWVLLGRAGSVILETLNWTGGTFMPRAEPVTKRLWRSANDRWRTTIGL